MLFYIYQSVNGKIRVYKNTFDTPVWKTGRIIGTFSAGGRRPQGFRSLFQRVFIQTWWICWRHNISTKFYNQPNQPTPELWLLNCPKLGFLFSKSKSFRPVLIKLGDYVNGHNIFTKFCNQQNFPTPKLWSLNCPKLEFYAL